MTDRITRWGWAMAMAKVTAQRSTCLRRHVGCVLVDKDFFVLATGYNGVPRGMDHCNKAVMSTPQNDKSDHLVYPHACPGATAASGTNLDGCHALHAEWNALIRCKDPREVFACFVTSSPCIMCTKMLMNTGCQQIYYAEEYPHPAAKELWAKMHGEGSWIHWTADMERQLKGV